MKHDSDLKIRFLSDDSRTGASGTARRPVRPFKPVYAVILLTFLGMTVARQAYAAAYYVSSSSGNDSNSGTSSSSPWQTLSKVMSRSLAAGDVVYLKAGDSWDSSRTDGTIVISNSGTSSSPITLTSYGTGSKPIIKNSGGGKYASAVCLKGSYIVVDGINAQNAGYGGVNIQSSANHNTVRNCEISNTGIGILISGQYNLVTANYIRNLRMVTNTSGGDDDYGATGIYIYNSHNEVSYNRLQSCYASSYDYGEDGGGVEFYANSSSVPITDCSIHHNWLYNTSSFSEIGGNSSSVSNIRFYYNVYINDHSTKPAFYFHNSGSFSVAMSNVTIQNNTIIHKTASAGSYLIGFSGTPTSAQVSRVANNIFYLDNWSNVFNQVGSIPHDHNLFYKPNGNTSFGLSMGSGDKIGNPLFTNLSTYTLTLQSGSPAINAGISLGYTSDYDGGPLSGAPDIGAYEYGSSISLSAPSNLRVIAP